MNKNIFEILDNLSKVVQPDTKSKQLVDIAACDEFQQEKELSDDSDMSVEEVVEVCPICQKKAYGKVVQCGTCWGWYHYDCLHIDDAAITSLGEDDFVCKSCTEDLLYSAPRDSGLERESEEQGENASFYNNDTSLTYTKTVDSSIHIDNSKSETSDANLANETIQIFDQSDLTQNTQGSKTPRSNVQNNMVRNSDKVKAKPTKKPSKSVKIKKENIVGKSYILELESKINQLQSTIDMYKRLENHNESTLESETAPCNNGCRNILKSSQSCSHQCYSELSDKLYENRIRLLETQMMQNLYINNAMHIQLVSQMRQYQQPICTGVHDPINYMQQSYGSSFHPTVGHSSLYPGYPQHVQGQAYGGIGPHIYRPPPPPYIQQPVNPLLVHQPVNIS